jgi:ABC-type dipeptide/oligopeptide/nickel transport system permease component
MIRWLVVEALRTAASLLLVSIVAFVLLDATGTHDWYGTLAPARSFGIPEHEALLLGTPRLFVREVEDATLKTQRDLLRLGSAQSARAARNRLLSRGAVVVPTLLSNLDGQPPSVQQEAYAILATISPTLTGGERAPDDPARARLWWDAFRVLHEIDFRDTYARRHVQRLIDNDSANARERLSRLGTLALPALFEALNGTLDLSSARRLCAMLSDLTGQDRRLPLDASASQARALVEGWRAWWFVHRLEYVRLGQTQRSIGRITESRYGRWLDRLIEGRLGPTRVTGRGALVELRERLPRSTIVAGLGGLFATALVVAFGGGATLRQRPLSTKLVDLTAALVPGLVAFALGFVALCSMCAGSERTIVFVRSIFVEWPSLLFAVALLTAPAALFLRRDAARLVLDAVRSEAESWAHESRTPNPAQIIRHGARVGVASLLAPAALNALVILALSVIVEPIARVRGMGALTLRAITGNDGVWLLIAALSIVPIAIGTRWARTALVWAMGGRRAVFARRAARPERDSAAAVEAP